MHSTATTTTTTTTGLLLHHTTIFGPGAKSHLFEKKSRNTKQS